LTRWFIFGIGACSGRFLVSVLGSRPGFLGACAWRDARDFHGPPGVLEKNSSPDSSPSKIIRYAPRFLDDVTSGIGRTQTRGALKDGKVPTAPAVQDWASTFSRTGTQGVYTSLLDHYYHGFRACVAARQNITINFHK